MDYDLRHKELMLPMVRVLSGKGGGSGTVICSLDKGSGEWSTYVLTNHHVVDGLISVKDQWSSLLQRSVKRDVRQTAQVHVFDYRWQSRSVGGTAVDSDIVAYDKDEDLALLHLRSARPAPAVAKMYPRGQEIELRLTMPTYCIGCGLLEPPVITYGMLSQFGREIDNREFWLATSPGIFGNCLPASTLIATNPSGPISIDQVEAGTKVYSLHDGRLQAMPARQRTLPVFKPTVRLTLSSRTLDASLDHPVLVATRQGLVRGKPAGQGAKTWCYDWVLEWCPAGNLKPRDIVTIATRLPEPPEVEPIGEDLARLAGCFLGDGYIRLRPHEGGEVGLCLFKPELIDRYRTILEHQFGKTVRHDPRRGLLVYSVDVARWFNEHGLNHRAIEKEIPPWIWKLPREEKVAFIEGYLDADGYVNPDGFWVFEANAERLIRQLRELCISIGWRVSNVSLRWRKCSKPNAKGMEFIQRAGSASFQAYPLSKKHALPEMACGLERMLMPGIGFERVRKTELLGTQACYDIEVPGAHNFVANGVVVHNSGGGLFLADTHEFIGVPARMAVIGLFGGADAITHLMYSIPVTRVYQFLEDQRFRFVYDPGFTEDGEAAERERMRREEELKIAHAEARGESR